MQLSINKNEIKELRRTSFSFFSSNFSLMKDNPINMKSCHQQESSVPSKTNQALHQSNDNETQSLPSSSSLKTLLEKHASDVENDSKCSSPNTHQPNDEETAFHGLLPAVDEDVKEEEPASGLSSDAVLQDDCGRERLKRHRVEVAGRVWIPDIWGQEDLLKDWIDCSTFEGSLAPNGIMSARAALIEEGRRANTGGLTIENRGCRPGSEEKTFSAIESG